ncbi:hypothetical protein ABZT06_27950 [Streptomyces sp. NPDC005483]|uniref:hypothetical protein n=1 Tax=Streptomyces sp. NPDC005483 TaxID=3154882 RepID=UPI0033A72D73
MRVHHTEEENSTRREIHPVRVQHLATGQVRFPHAAQALLIEWRGDRRHLGARR